MTIWMGRVRVMWVTIWYLTMNYLPFTACSPQVIIPFIREHTVVTLLVFLDIFCLFSRQMDTVQVQVLSPLNSLLSLFQGPQRLIQKRNDKCLDYDRWSNKIDKIKDRDKLKAVSYHVLC